MSDATPGQTKPSAGAARPAGEAVKEHALRDVFRSADLRKLLPKLALNSFLSNLLALAVPLAILQVLDRVVANKSLGTLALLAVGVVAALILEEVLRSLNGIVTAWLGTRYEHSASIAALERLMHVPMQHYQRQEPGGYAEKVLAAAKVADFYSGQALLVLFDLPFVVIFLSLISVIGGWLVVVPTTLLLIFALMIAHFGRWMRKEVEQRNIVDDRRYNFLAEVLGGIHSVKGLMMEPAMQRRYERLQEANAEQGERLTHGSTIASGVGTLFSQVMIVGVVFFGSWVVTSGNMTPGGLAACILLSVRSLQPLRRSLSVWLRYQSFSAAYARLCEVMSMPWVSDEGKPLMPAVAEGIELRDIEVGYGGGRKLFSGLSLSIPAGECIAIQGESGDGKSTLLSLLNGIVQPNLGTVLVDGSTLDRFSEASVHKEIAYLPQSGVVIAGTILENLTMFDDSLNAKALDVAKKMGLDKVVAGMRHGYETVLGQSATETLPHGVRQLITIVRALTREPSVLLFDEANISLDIEADRLLRNYLEGLKGRCTMVLVTHRPSLLTLADHVYRIADGRLQERSAEDLRSFAPSGAPLAVLERPQGTRDFAKIVYERIEEESDLSVCLLKLVELLDWQGQPRELADAIPHMVRRLDLSGFCAALAHLGYQARHFHGSVGQIDHRLLPCLFVPPDRPAIIVSEWLSNGRLRAFDSATGTMRELEETPQIGEAFIFQSANEPKREAKATAGWFNNLAWRFRRHIALAFILTLGSTALTLATPLFVKSIYERVLPTGDMRLAAYLLAGVGIAVVLNWALLNFKSRVLAYLGGRTEYLLGTSMFERIIGLPASSSEGASVGRQLGRIKNLEKLREFFVGPLGILVFELPATLLMLVALAFINPWAVGVIGLSVTAFVILGYLMRGVGERYSGSSSRLAAMRWELLNEALTAMPVIRLAGAGPTWVERFRELSGKAGKANFEDTQLRARFSGIARIVGTLTGSTTLFVSAVVAVKGGLTGGAIVASMMIVWRLVGPIQNIFFAADAVTRTRGNMRQVENLMRLPGENDNGVRQSIRPGTQGALNLVRVSFRYANDADPVLLGVNFTVKPRELVVITGHDGAGKSTLLKLLVRNFVPQAGSIRLDNVDIRQLTAVDLRSRISYMPQKCEVFYGTVAQNLRFAYPPATDEELQWAVEMAGLTREIDALPEGLETRLSNSRSDQLPNGFRQRLSLARTILKPASVVLMDEPGAGMDRSGEESLMRCIEWLRGRATLIIVSHRPGHMRMADTVVYLESGAVAALGPFDKVQDKVMSGLR